MIIGELDRLCSAISSVSRFLEINFTRIEETVTLYTFVVLISQFLENYMLSNQNGPAHVISFKLGS